MKITDQLFLLKNSILKKENGITIIILSLIFTAIFACFTIMNFVSSFRTNMLESSTGRIIVIDKPSTVKEMEEIKNINHIELIESSKYMNGVEVLARQFDKSKIGGIIQLKPLLDDSDIKITQGKNIRDSGDILCPVNFYPHSLYIFDNYGAKKEFYSSYMLDGRKLIGDTIKLEDEKKEEYSFNVIGAFNNKVLDELNVCYTSKTDFDKFKGDIDYCADEVCYEFNSLMIRIDNYKNINDVEKALSNLGYSSIKLFTFDEEALTNMTYIPLFICTIALLISVAIVYNFLKKKSANNQYKYGILKSVGYTDKNVISIAKNEGILIYIISIIISLILYLISFIIITNNSLQELSYNNFAVQIPWLIILLFIITSLIYIIFIIKKFTKKTLSLCVQNLFEG